MSSKAATDTPIIWIDCEMTGIDPAKDEIMEIACVVTDKNLEVIADGPNIIIHKPDNILNNLSSWHIEHFTKTNLIEASRQSTISVQDAEKEVLTFLEKHTTAGTSPLAGNTIYMDRIFINKEMPNLGKYCHYRLIDVSSVKELCNRWNKEIYNKQPKKKLMHRARDDIYESIFELKYYKQFMFK